MGELLHAGDRLEGMGKGVAEVQPRPLAFFREVLVDDLDLDRGAARHDVGEQRRVAREHPLPLALEQGEQILVAERRGLDDLGEPGAVLALGKRRQGVDADPHFRGRVKGAHHVLVAAPVDPGLSADRGVDHRQQRGGHEGEAAAAHVQRRGKGGHVADDAAADPHDHARAREAEREGAGQDELDRCPGFRPLARRHDDRVGLAAREQAGRVLVEHVEDALSGRPGQAQAAVE